MDGWTDTFMKPNPSEARVRSGSLKIRLRHTGIGSSMREQTGGKKHRPISVPTTGGALETMCGDRARE